MRERRLGWFGHVEHSSGAIRTACDIQIDENQLAVRQLAVKTLDSNSWFVAVMKLYIMYGLSNCVDLLDNPPTKASWKRTVNRAVCTYWAGRLQSIVPLYPSLKWLTFDATEWPKRHSLSEVSEDLREVPRIAVHLKIVTGTYILQTRGPDGPEALT